MSNKTNSLLQGFFEEFEENPRHTAMLTSTIGLEAETVHVLSREFLAIYQYIEQHFDTYDDSCIERMDRIHDDMAMLIHRQAKYFEILTEEQQSLILQEIFALNMNSKILETVKFKDNLKRNPDAWNDLQCTNN